MSASAPPMLPDLNSGPRNFITTDQDHGGVALTICTLMATYVVLCFVVRIYMRATVSGPFGIDDWVCTVATAFGVVQMIVSSVAISYGLGKSLELLSQAQIEAASKALYAAQLLYIVTNALTKCTVALLLARLVFIKKRVYACYGVLAASVLWGVGSFIAEAVRCSDHLGWKIAGSQCSNLFTAWQAITAFNVIIELLLLAFPIWLVFGLQTDRMKKFTVVAVFWLRSPVIVAALLRLHFLHDTIGSTEPLLHGVVPFTLLNIEMHYGLMAATFPTLKPFVGAFNTGWGTYDSRGVSGYSHGSGGRSSYVMQSLDNNRNKSRRKSSLFGGVSKEFGSGLEKEEEARGCGVRYGKNVVHVRSGGSASRHSEGSEESSSHSQGMIIHQTVTAEVHYEEGTTPIKSRDFISSRGSDSIDFAPHGKLS